MRVVVWSTDKDVLQRWQSIMGGKLYQRNPNAAALGSKIGYYVEIGTIVEARAAIEVMLPWLGERRQSQVAAVLAKVDANPPTQYGTGWAKRRALYGETGRRVAVGE